MDDFKLKVIEVIKDWFQNQGFHARKLTDTPTDDFQVVNKKYVDTHGGGSPAGSDKDIQFNDAGSFGGDDAFQFNKTTKKVSVIDATQTGAVDVYGGVGSSTIESRTVSNDKDGTNLNINAANGDNTKTNGTPNGGNVAITAGLAAGSGANGSISINGQNIDLNGNGPYISLFASSTLITLGADVQGDGGNFNWFPGGAATNVNNGFVHITYCAGAPTGTPTQGVGAMMYDTTNNKLYIYNGAWKSVLLT